MNFRRWEYVNGEIRALSGGTANHSTANHSTANHSTANHSTANHSTANHSTPAVNINSRPRYRPCS